MQAKPKPELSNCIRCDVIPLAGISGIQCPKCKAQEKTLDEWNKTNKLATIEDAPVSIVHEQYGLTPRAIELLMFMRENARWPLEVLRSSGLDDFTQKECDLLMVYIIGSLTSRPEPEKLRIGAEYIVIC